MFAVGLHSVRAPGHTGRVETMQLRQITGIRVHITGIYSVGWSYLKSICNVLEAFRYNCDAEGRRLASTAISVLKIKL